MITLSMISSGFDSADNQVIASGVLPEMIL